MRLRGAVGSQLSKAKLKGSGVGGGWRLQYLKGLLWHSLFSGGVCRGKISPFQSLLVPLLSDLGKAR